MYSSEPLPHFVDDYLALPAGGASDHRRPRRRPRARRPARGLRPAGHRGRPPVPGGVRPPAGRDRPGRADGRRARRAADAGRPHQGADVRAGGDADLGAEPALVRGHHRLQPGDAGAVHAMPRPPSARAGCSRSSGRCPRLIQAARDNVKDPPGIFVKVGIETFNGALRVHRARPAARVPRAWTTCTCSATWPTPRPRRRTPSAATSTTSRRSWRPKARASFRLGREKFEQKLRLEEGVGLSVDRLLAIAERELAATAGRLPDGRRQAQWRRPRGGVGEGQGAAPGAGRAHRRRAAADWSSSQSFLERQKLLTLPASEPVVRRADARLLPLVERQHVDAGAVRERARAARTTT